MDLTAIDSKNAGILNEKRVMELLRQEGALSQAQIRKKTGLGSSTIAYIVGRLRTKGLITEKQGYSTKRGAKPVLIEINPAGLFVIGSEINPSYLLIGFFDFHGNLMDHLKISLDQDHSVERVVNLLEVNIKGLLSKHAITVDKIAGIGATLSGTISSNGVVQMSSSLGWTNVPLKKLLTERFESSVEIYTTRVRLLAEMNMKPLLTSKNIVYLNVSSGVGATIIVDGRLIHGATNQSGELGHIVIDPNGPLCGCGRKGCLEAHLSGPAISKRILTDIHNGVKTVLSQYIEKADTPEQYAEKWKLAIEKSDEYALILRGSVAEMLSRAAALTINLFDPDVLILAGYVNAVCPEYFADQIRSRFKSDVYDESSRSIEIIHTRAGQKALIRGVAEAILQEQFITL